MGDYLRNEIKPDVIFWTGDTPPGGMYDYNEDYVKSYVKYLADYMKTNLSDFSIHAIEGNHDFAVPNSQDFTKLDSIIGFSAE